MQVCRNKEGRKENNARNNKMEKTGKVKADNKANRRQTKRTRPLLTA